MVQGKLRFKEPVCNMETRISNQQDMAVVTKGSSKIEELQKDMFKLFFAKKQRVVELDCLNIEEQFNGKLTLMGKLEHVRITIEEETKRKHVLENGPWMMYGHIFSVKEWIGASKMEEYNFDFVKFWVQIWDLPKARINKANVWKIGVDLGTIYEADLSCPPEFNQPVARVRVELDIKERLSKDQKVRLETGDILETITIAGTPHKLRFEETPVASSHGGRGYNIRARQERWSKDMGGRTPVNRAKQYESEADNKNGTQRTEITGTATTRNQLEVFVMSISQVFGGSMGQKDRVLNKTRAQEDGSDEEIITRSRGSRLSRSTHLLSTGSKKDASIAKDIQPSKMAVASLPNPTLGCQFQSKATRGIGVKTMVSRGKRKKQGKASGVANRGEPSPEPSSTKSDELDMEFEGYEETDKYEEMEEEIQINDDQDAAMNPGQEVINYEPQDMVGFENDSDEFEFQPEPLAMDDSTVVKKIQNYGSQEQGQGSTRNKERGEGSSGDVRSDEESAGVANSGVIEGRSKMVTKVMDPGLVRGFQPAPDGPDIAILQFADAIFFSWRVLVERNRGVDYKVHNFLMQLVWKVPIPLKVKFLFWSALLGRTLTADALIHRGSVVSLICTMCGMVDESISHLFLHCSYSLEVWSIMMQPFGLSFPRLARADSLEDLLRCWQKMRGNGFIAKLWKLTPYAVLWVLWKTRNDRVFHEKIIPPVRACIGAKDFFWYWLCTSPTRRHYHITSRIWSFTGTLSFLDSK
ncbi:hypothetical protein IFM89_032503 [Coptis chinensis]|uniref:Reverse transcriptase zinc-binding domain-containing protein n=1 Tax=Coptis chinensis TaxID=261450 RepID=A0A835ISJ5_9MAGN|nr:hypothetical protein IFM89_032503 [Coptis chinensis]